MSFESLYNWDEIPCEWAEDLDKNDIFKKIEDNNLYFLRNMTGLHALILSKKFDQAKITIEKLLAETAKLKTAGLEEKSISTKVLSHVAYVTIQQSFEKMDLHEKAKEVEKNVTPLVMITDMEKSTLYGIKSYCFYQYFNDLANQLAMKFAKKAIKLNPNCSYWNLVYAMCLRKSRRDFGHSDNVRIASTEEMKYFEIAYSQNTTPYFGTRLAQCYKESRDQEKALNIFKELQKMHIESPDIWLRIALGFMYYKKFEPAKECLDKAEQIDNSMEMLHHYKGLYYMKGYNNYDEAMIHLKKSSDEGNFKAFMDYVYCVYCKDPNDRTVLELLKESFEKYASNKFEIGLSIALYYGKNLNQYKKALIYMSDTVKQNPKDGYLKNFFYSFTNKSHNINIFKYIKNELLPKSKSILDSKNRKFWEAYEYLQDFVQTNKMWSK